MKYSFVLLHQTLQLHFVFFRSWTVFCSKVAHTSPVFGSFAFFLFVFQSYPLFLMPNNCTSVISNCDCYLAHMDHFLSTSVDPECSSVSLLCLPFACPGVYLPILGVSFFFSHSDSDVVFFLSFAIFCLNMITNHFPILSLTPAALSCRLICYLHLCHNRLRFPTNPNRNAPHYAVASFQKCLNHDGFPTCPVYSPTVRRRGLDLLTGYPPHYRISSYFWVSGYTTSSLRCVHVSLFSLLPFFKYTTRLHHVYLTILLLISSGRVDCIHARAVVHRRHVDVFYFFWFVSISAHHDSVALPGRALRNPWLQVHPLFHWLSILTLFMPLSSPSPRSHFSPFVSLL